MRFCEGDAVNASIHVRARRCCPDISFHEATLGRVARRIGVHSTLEVRSPAAAPLRDRRTRCGGRPVPAPSGIASKPGLPGRTVRTDRMHDASGSKRSRDGSLQQPGCLLGRTRRQTIIHRDLARAGARSLP